MEGDWYLRGEKSVMRMWVEGEGLVFDCCKEEVAKKKDLGKKSRGWGLCIYLRDKSSWRVVMTIT